MNVIMAFAVFASLVNGAAVPATIASTGRAISLSFESLNAQHVDIGKRDIELGNEEYMSMWWSGQDVINQQSYSAQEHSIALNQPALAAPEAPPAPSSSLSLSSLPASLSSSQSSPLSPSQQKCSDETSTSTSESHPQSQPIHIIEESGLPMDPAPANAAPSNIVVNNSVCRTGMMRCAGDGSFDTCLFGKWGTVRLCAQGTKCISQDDYIACTY
ncbi:hypothetical protein GGH12_002992 [Coemansia sp. RSA 1822]|nr:hypothetical protein LPJ76_005350 [Coemansia sp. RSA 638]KAJ2121226.1 hypothetical protein IW147_004456 [Coemansia sp. RSA 720]KAJ2540590.1 hypothetical protein GGF49_004335 [Coemansia sp. RSA 1853]KAJ2562752.1 hypothetical protein GGH12_002992 [Coemansia sp. RSA 1822]